MKDCTTCKYGYEDEQFGIPMCHHPERFSEDCVDFNMYEEKEIKKSEKPNNHLEGLDDAAHEYVTQKKNNWLGDDAWEFILHAFKAGAKWDREQMMKEAKK